MKVVFKKNILSQQVESHDLEDGLSLERIISTLKIDTAYFSYLRIYVDDLKIKNTWWGRIFPKKERKVFIYVVPGGKDLVKALPIIIAVVGLVLVATGVLSPLGAGLLMLAANFGVSMLFKPTTPTISAAAYKTVEDSQFSQILSVSNQMKPFQAVPRVYGKVKFFPPLAAEPYYYDGSVTLLLDLGVNAIDFANTKIYVGDTLIERLENPGNIQPNYVVRPGSAFPFKYYKFDYHVEGVNVDVTSPNATTPNLHTVGALPANAYEVSFYFNQGLFTQDTAGNIGAATIQFKIEMSLDNGTTWADITTLAGFKANTGGHTAQNVPGTITQVRNIAIKNRSGVWWNSSTSSFYPVGGVVYNNRGAMNYTFQMDWLEVDSGVGEGDIIQIPVVGANMTGFWEARVERYEAETKRAYFYAGSTKWPYNIHGGAPTYGNTKADVGYSMIASIGNPSAATYNSVFWIAAKVFTSNITAVTNNTKAPYRAIYSWEGPTPRQNVLVRAGMQSYSPPTPYYIAKTCIFETITTKQYTEPVKPPVAHTFLEFYVLASKELGDNLNQITVETIGSIKKYNRTTAAWEENFSEASNPAWQFVDILCGGINPAPLPYSRLDLPSILAWADWCNTKTRIFFAPDIPKDVLNADVNFLLDYNTTVLALLNQVCAAGRATLTSVNGKFGVIMDAEKVTPVQLFTPRNYRDFSSTRTYSKMADALKVSFVDSMAAWQANERLVYNDGYSLYGGTVNGNPTAEAKVFESVDSFGLITQEQAWKFGRYQMARAKLRREQITLTTDFESVFCERGDRVSLVSQTLKIGGQPARIKNIVGLIIELDAPISIVTGVDVIEARSQVSGVNIIDVTNVDVTGFFLTLASVALVQVGNLIVYGQKEKTSLECLVDSIEVSDDLSCQLSLIEYAPEIYKADAQEIPPYDPAITELPSNIPSPLYSLDVLENIIHLSDRSMSQMNFLFQLTPNETYTGVEVYVKTPTDLSYMLYDIIPVGIYTWSYQVRASENLQNIVAGKTYSFKFLAVGRDGGKLPLPDAKGVSILLKGDTIRPLPPSTFKVNTANEQMQVTWTPPIDAPDLAGYYIRFAGSNNLSLVWEYFVPCMDLVPAGSTDVYVPYRIGQYAIKAVDFSGNVSEELARARTVMPHYLYYSDIFEIDGNAINFAGYYHNVEVVSNQLQLVKSYADHFAPDGYYIPDVTFDFGFIASMRISEYPVMYPINLHNIVANWPIIATMSSLVVYDEGDIFESMEYRVASLFADLADWGALDTVDPIAQVTDWSPWRKIISGYVTGRYLQIRLHIGRNKNKPWITPAIPSYIFKIEAPLRDEWNDNPIPYTGPTMVVAFGTSFFGIPKIIITLDDGQTGDYYLMVNIDGQGFEIQIFDSTGADANGRLFSYKATGSSISNHESI